MTISISVTVLLVFTLNSVSCQHSVQGFVGENVTLPCIYSTSRPAQASVYWRGKDERVVFDIKKGSVSYDHQHEKYEGRVRSFPEEYAKGNYSINLKNLQKNDADTYKCYVNGENPITVKLTISSEPVAGGAAGGATAEAAGRAADEAAGRAAGGATDEAAGRAADEAAGGAAGLNFLQVALLCPLCLLLCF